MKQNTKSLIDCLLMDEIPSLATQVDFGIDQDPNHRKFGALQWAFKNGKVDEYELDCALGDGGMLTEIVRRGDNPYGDVIIETAWDYMDENDE